MNGDEYSGDWFYDTMGGCGIYRYENKDRYEGHMRVNVREGKGKME
jgi:hypothetical protein